MLYQNRVDRIIEYMKEDGLPQLLIADDSNLRYLTGKIFMALERVGVMLIRDDGLVQIFANDLIDLPELEAPIFRHCDLDDPYRDLAKALRPGKLGVDQHWSAGHLLGLMGARPDIIPVPGSRPVEMARMLKDQEELQLLRKSSALNDEAVAFAISLAAQNSQLSEAEMSERIDRFFTEHGAGKSPWFQLTCFGKNAAAPHHEPDRVSWLQPGDVALFDLFAPVDGYWCDITRTVFYREASDRHRHIYELVKQAQQAAVDQVRPGATIRQVYEPCAEILRSAGYAYNGRIGHGIGVDVHEYPDISPKHDLILRPGMAFTLEPGIYLEGDIGVRIEDTVIVTEKGCEVLNHYPKELQVVG